MLLLSLYRAGSYDEQAKQILVSPNATRFDPNRASRRWLEGMSMHLKRGFSSGLRDRREKLGLTHQELADVADMTSTVVTMIERGERAPSLDTATRLCWALDVAADLDQQTLE